MASVYNNVSNNSLSSSVRGYGGLASGLDRDSLIQGMTAGTRAKIAKQQKGKQTLLWKQEAYRSISTKLIEFSQKYTSYTNPDTNLASAAFWSKSNVTALGTNSKYIQVSGSPANSSAVSIVGVKQLAEKASATSSSPVSNGILSTGDINVDEEKIVSTLEGQKLTFKVGDKTFDVQLKSGTVDGFTYDYSDGAKTVESITKAMEGVSVGGRKLSELIKVEEGPAGSDSQATPFTLNFKSIDVAHNSIRLAGGSEGALKALGFENSEDFAKYAEQGQTEIKEDGMEAADILKDKQKFFEPLSFQDRVDGKKMTFTYNGVSKTITLAFKSGDSLKKFAEDIETKLAKEFGSNRIKVDGSTGKLQFTTQTPDGVPDKTSNLVISGADIGVIGKDGALNVASGQSNRLRLDGTFLEFQQSKNPGFTKDATDPLYITINGKNIEDIYYGSTMSEIIDKINNSDAGVTVTYMKDADRFSIVSKEDGASGSIEFNATTEDKDGNIVNTDNVKLFGSLAGTEDSNGVVTPSQKITGKDAIVFVKYGDSSEPVELTRGGNSFNLDGLNVTVNGTFNVEGKYDKEQEVTFNAKADTDKIVKVVSDMIKEYNDIIKLVKDQVSTKPNRKYEPLTDEQKEQMKDSQIEKWEQEAKKGLLFNDSDLRSLSDSLRFVFSAGSESQRKLAAFGISTSSDYAEQGSLVLDETKFREALEKSPEELKDLFTKKEDKSTGETGGFMSRLTAITDTYASTKGAVKGSLIEKAGSIYAPNSILSNSLQKSINSFDDYIERLQDQLQTETDRYIKQFTSLETLISQMNSQSSWLSSVGGQ